MYSKDLKKLAMECLNAGVGLTNSYFRNYLKEVFLCMLGEEPNEVTSSYLRVTTYTRRGINLPKGIWRVIDARMYHTEAEDIVSGYIIPERRYVLISPIAARVRRTRGEVATEVLRFAIRIWNKVFPSKKFTGIDLETSSMDRTFMSSLKSQYDLIFFTTRSAVGGMETVSSRTQKIIVPMSKYAPELMKKLDSRVSIRGSLSGVFSYYVWKDMKLEYCDGKMKRWNGSIVEQKYYPLMRFYITVSGLKVENIIKKVPDFAKVADRFTKDKESTRPLILPFNDRFPGVRLSDFTIDKDGSNLKYRHPKDKFPLPRHTPKPGQQVYFLDDLLSWDDFEFIEIVGVFDEPADNVFQAQDKFFFSTMDESQSCLIQLPEKATTCEAAQKMLQPKYVQAAFKKDKRVLRQGEVYLVKEYESYLDMAMTNKWDLVLLKNQFKSKVNVKREMKHRKASQGNSHIALRGYKHKKPNGDNVLYVTGELKHVEGSSLVLDNYRSSGEHDTISLPGIWSVHFNTEIDSRTTILTKAALLD